MKEPVSYRRVPVRLLRAFPIRNNPRLELLDYRLTLAPGMIGGRRPRTHGHGAARLSGGFIVAVCLTRDGGQWWLEAQAAPYDEAADRHSPMTMAPRLLADIYRAVQARQVAAEGNAYGRGKGRN